MSASKRRDRSTPWSDWIWSEELDCHYAIRCDENGITQYDYFPPRESAPEQQAEVEVEEEPVAEEKRDDASQYQTYNTNYTASSTRNSYTARNDRYEPPTQSPEPTATPLSSYRPTHNAESDGGWPDKSSSSRGFEVISRPTRFFKIGRVFKVLWTEPAGNNAENPNVTASPFGGNVFTKMRLFVVVREMKGCCLCLMLFTHNGQGTAKRGVQPEDYAAVYDSVKGYAETLPTENITKKPFKIIVENPAESIHPMSRLNFGRVYTIEHNIKVLKVGRIPNDQFAQLERYFVASIAGPQYSNDTSENYALDPVEESSGTGNQSYQDPSTYTNDASSYTSSYTIPVYTPPVDEPPQEPRKHRSRRHESYESRENWGHSGSSSSRRRR